MHKNILTSQQVELLPLVKKYANSFYLVGGTALALQLGHRRSIDFDLFSKKEFDANQINADLKNSGFELEFLVDSEHELTLVCNDVKMTFYCYPYDISHQVEFENIITMPNVLDLAAMKAFVLGRRAKWKDYVDLYWIFNKCHSLEEVIARTKEIFGTSFNSKLLKEQLCYFDDINHSEPIEYLNEALDDEMIKKTLCELATEKAIGA